MVKNRIDKNKTITTVTSFSSLILNLDKFVTLIIFWLSIPLKSLAIYVYIVRGNG